MKKKYTKKQIQEAIAYWKKQLNESRDFKASAQVVLPPNVEKNMMKISGHIYSFIKQVFEEYPDEFDIKYFQDFAKDILDFLKKK